MTIWRPRQSIRVISIGLHWRGDALLAMEVLDDAGRLKGVRPLGGGVDFGETWRDALIREFHEELGLAITITGAPLTFENIYTHEGATGHEIVFAADIALPDGAHADQDVITFQEDNGVPCTARWFDLRLLDTPDGPALFPTGLKDRIVRR